MTVKTKTGAGPPAPSPLELFVTDVIRRRAAVQSLDWTVPESPPEPPDFKSVRLKWDAPGAMNRISGAPISLESLRKEMPERMKAYLKEPGQDALLVKVAAGAGKTTSAVEVAQYAAEVLKWRVLWVGGRHDMFDQLNLVPGFNSALWYHWQPIQLDEENPDDPAKSTCRYAKEQHIWSGKGYSTMGLCQQLCYFDGYMKKCPYRLQAKQKQRIVYAMHKHLIVGLSISNFKLVIVDENPLTAFTNDRRVPPDDMALKGVTGPLEKLLEMLRFKVTELGNSSQRQCSGRELLETIGPVLVDVYAQIEVNPNAIPLEPRVWAPEQVSSAPSSFVMELLTALVLEHKAWEAGWNQWAERVKVAKDGLHILERGKPWEKLPRKMLVLDATANEPLYRQIFDRPLKVYAPEIQRAGRIYQVAGRLNGKSTMYEKKKKVTTSQADEALAVARQIAAPYGEKKERVCVICAKDVQQLFEREFGESNVAHFYGLRGTNEFLDAACLIVIGAPSPDIRSVIDTAVALNPRRALPYARRDEDGNYQPVYHTAEREYRISHPLMQKHEGKAPWRAIKGYWNQPELQAVYDQLREAELVQALHRSRVNTRSATVWLLTSVPTSETLDGIWDDPPEQAGFPEGIYWKQWLRIQPTLDAKRKEGLPITNEDLAEAANVGLDYVQRAKWLDAIAKHQPGLWAIDSLRPETGRGRAKKALLAA